MSTELESKQSGWFFAVDGESKGPFSWDELVSAVKSDAISDDTMIYHSTFGDWKPAHAIDGLLLTPAQAGEDANRTIPSVKGVVRWQYHIERSTVVERWSTKRQAQEIQAFQQRLNELGQQGWEMIGFESVPLVGSLTGSQKGYVYLSFFKRPQ